MRGRLVAVMLAITGCSPNATFSCVDNQACGVAGICEPDGFCSFVDESCVPSGRRYDQFAGGGLAGTCVGGSSAVDAGDQEDGNDAVDGSVVSLGVYATTQTQLFTVDPGAGTASLVGTYSCTSGPVTDIALSQTGAMYGVVRTAAPITTVLFEVTDRSTAACTVLGTITGLPNNTAIVALAFIRGGGGGSDRLLGANDASGRLLEIDPGTLLATDLGTHDGGVFAEGDLSYVTGLGLFESITDISATQQLATISLAPMPSPGHATPIGVTLRRYEGLATFQGVLYGFSSDGRISEINPTTAAEINSEDNSTEAWTGAAAAPPQL